MKLHILGLGLLACLAAVNAMSSSRKLNEEWKLYKKTFLKHYQSPAEDTFRMSVFKSSMELVEEHNRLFESGASTFKMAVNQFSDLLHEEFIARNHQYRTVSSRNRTKNIHNLPITNAPSAIDWRSQNAVSDVKNQGDCGGCWAFSTTGSLEGQIAIKNGNLVSLSEQNLIDCVGNDNNCEGGNVEDGYEYIRTNGGIDSDGAYEWEVVDLKCRYQATDSAGTCTGYKELPAGDEGQLKEALASIGPISVAIDASLPSFKHYSSGLFYDPKCSSKSDDLGHAVLAVGYGSDGSNNDFYIVKNSWGKSWGEAGYVRMARNRDNNCGIAMEGLYPTI